MAQSIRVYWVQGNDQFLLKRSLYDNGADSWGSPATFYDSSVDPPAQPPSGAATPFLQGITFGTNDDQGFSPSIRTNDFPNPARTQLFYGDNTGTNPPIAYDLTNRVNADTANLKPQGPFSYGGNLYTIGSSSTKHITVYKSTDSGATWTAQDNANSPGTAGKSLNYYYNTAENKVYTVAVNSSDQFVLREFSFASDTWGSDHDTNTTVTFGGLTPRPTSITKLANGDIFVTYNKAIAAFPSNVTVFACKLSGGTWTNDIQISANHFSAQDTFEQVVNTGSVTYIFWNQSNGGHTRLFTRRRDDDGTLGTTNLFPDEINGGVNVGRGEFFDGEIWVPYKSYIYATSGPAGVSVQRGTPIQTGTDATWTADEVTTIADNYDYPYLLLSGQDAPSVSDWLCYAVEH